MQIPIDQEVWRGVNEFSNYQVSSHGRVRNCKTGRILKAFDNQHGYLHVQLNQNGKIKTFRIHRLVAEAFCENPNNYDTVDHQDKNKLNNYYQNLRFASSKMQARNTSLSRKNSSGIKGVSFHKAVNSWIGQINDDNGNHISKGFSCNKYPNAKQLAIDWRRQKEQDFSYQ